MAELNQGSVVTGKLDQDTPAVFITGINSQGIAVTDILVWQEDAGLVNAALDRSTGLSTATAPYRQLTPQDINGDGITELPRPDSSVSDTKQADGMVFWEQYRARRPYHRGAHLSLPVRRLVLHPAGGLDGRGHRSHLRCWHR